MALVVESSFVGDGQTLMLLCLEFVPGGSMWRQELIFILCVGFVELEVLAT